MQRVSLAAKFRVLHREAHAAGGLRCRTWFRRLVAAETASPRVVRRGRWSTWFNTSFCHLIISAAESVRQAGISLTRAQERAAGAARPWTQAQECRSVTGLQRATCDLLQERDQRDPERRMRSKLEHWVIPLFPRLRAQRAVVMLQRITALVPPRVTAAVIRTLWSGWCTGRRFGGRNACMYCGMEDGDSVEHATVCGELARFGARYLRLPYVSEVGPRRLSFLLLDPPSELSDVRLTLGALRVAAAYRLHCRFRNQRAALRGEHTVRRALEQAVREAVQGHRGATTIFDSRWA